MDKDSTLYTTVFTAIITVIFVAVLAYVYDITKGQVALNVKIAREQALLGSIGVELNGEDDASLYQQYFGSQDLNGTEFTAEVDGRKIAVRYFEGKGLWSTLKGFLALSEDASTIYGIEFTEQNETPGLGGEITKPSFKNQFKNLQLPNGEMGYATAANPADLSKGMVDSIAGATRTSDSVKVIVDTVVNDMKGGQ